MSRGVWEFWSRVLCLFFLVSGGGQASYEAEIRWSSYGVPHIKADNFKNLGFGAGYAFSKQNFCILADQLLKVKSQRSKYFGPGDEKKNIISDIGYKALNVLENAHRLYPTLSLRSQDLIEGYAAGYNQYLEERGLSGLPRPCRGASWVTETTKEELLAYYFTLAMLASGETLMPMFVLAQSPLDKQAARESGQEPLSDELPEIIDYRDLDLGSNAWGIGRDLSANSRGMLLANPHFPGTGALKFYQQHLTIPGVIDVNGVSIYGTPVVQIGFNEHLAWSHTVSTSRHFNFYSLQLKRRDPLKYKYGNETKEITRIEHTIEVLQDDGSVQPFVQATYRSHYGPIIEAALMGWSRSHAYTFRDANENNVDFIDQWFEMGAAQNLSEFQNAFREYRGTPWVNTIYADREGNSFFVEGTPVPNLSLTSYRAWSRSFFAQLIHGATGAFLFNGSDPSNEWGGPRGLVEYDQAPKLLRSDFVGNHNNSHWLTNVNEPLEGYPLIYGPEKSQQSYRTRMGNDLLMNSRGTDSLFSLDELESAYFSNRVKLYELVGDDLRQRCQSWQRGSHAGIKEACQAYAQWNGRMDLDSVGGHVFREFAAGIQNKHFKIKFDEEDPLNTPRSLRRPGIFGDSVKTIFSKAVQALQTAGIDFFSPLRDLQYFQKESTRIPYSGAMSFAGGFNVVAHSSGNGRTLYHYPQTEVINKKSGLSEQGYLINNGASIVMFAGFSDQGPQVSGFLSYSQSSDPDSPHYSDQNWLYSRKQMRPFLLKESDILADPNLQIERVVR